jgi:hypothetical protein
MFSMTVVPYLTVGAVLAAAAELIKAVYRTVER